MGACSVWAESVGCPWGLGGDARVLEAQRYIARWGSDCLSGCFSGRSGHAKASGLGSWTIIQDGKGGRSGERDEQGWGHMYPIYRVTPSAKAGPRAPSLAPSLCWACCQMHLHEAQLSLEVSFQNFPQLPFTFKIKSRLGPGTR